MFLNNVNQELTILNAKFEVCHCWPGGCGGGGVGNERGWGGVGWGGTPWDVQVTHRGIFSPFMTIHDKQILASWVIGVQK